MLHSVSEELVGRLDVALHNLLQILKEFLSANLKLCADRGSRSFVVLLNINVHDILLVELPCQSDVVGTFGARPKDKLSNVNITKLFNSCSRVDIHKLGMINSTRYETTGTSGAITITRRSSHLERVVFQIFFGIIDALDYIGMVRLQVLPLAVESNSEPHLVLV